MITASEFLKWAKIFHLISSDGPVPPAYIPPGGSFVPVFTPNGGINGDITLLSAKYSGNINAAGGIITVTTTFEVSADDSNDLMEVKITNPFQGNFSNTHDAQSLAFSICKVSNVGVPGAVADGWFHDLIAEVGAGVILTFEGASPSTNYRVSSSWMYQINAPQHKKTERKNA